MKKFKIIDFQISVILIILCTVFAFCKQGESFFIGYFLVGGWQVISMLVHFFNRWFCQAGTKRLNYHFTVLVIFIVAASGIVIPGMLYLVLVILLFAAPFMAIFYTWLCYNEVYVKMQRPLALLK